MVDVVRDPVNTRTSQAARTRRVQYGVTVEQGQAVFSPGGGETRFFLSQSDDPDTSFCGGVVLTPNVADGWGEIQTNGPMEIGPVVEGTIYCVSAANPGEIAPHADLVSGNSVISIGIGGPNNVLQVGIYETGTVIP